MRFEKLSSVRFFVAILLALSMFIMGIRGIKLEDMKFSGTIAAVDEDQKSITVSGARVSKIIISSGTKIVDEKGNVVGMNSLRSRSTIEVEGWYNPSGPFYARKITVRAPKQKP